MACRILVRVAKCHPPRRKLPKGRLGPQGFGETFGETYMRSLCKVCCSAWALNRRDGVRRTGRQFLRQVVEAEEANIEGGAQNVYRCGRIVPVGAGGAAKNLTVTRACTRPRREQPATTRLEKVPNLSFAEGFAKSKFRMNSRAL